MNIEINPPVLYKIKSVAARITSWNQLYIKYPCGGFHFVDLSVFITPELFSFIENNFKHELFSISIKKPKGIFISLSLSNDSVAAGKECVVAIRPDFPTRKIIICKSGLRKVFHFEPKALYFQRLIKTNVKNK